jgi:hypothetical protein
MGHKIVCFECRKAFNVGADYNGTQSSNCPECGQLAERYQHCFRPPRRNATKQWEVVRFLNQHGFYYQHISDGKSYAAYPTTLLEAREFVITYAEKSAKAHNH